MAIHYTLNYFSSSALVHDEHNTKFTQKKKKNTTQRKVTLADLIDFGDDLRTADS